MTRAAVRYGRGRVGVLGALAAAAVLAGCAGQPGAAAVIDGRTITVDDLHGAVAELGPFYQGATPDAVLAVLLQESTVREFAAEQGIAVSDQAARTRLAEAAAQVESGADAEFGATSLAVSRYLIVWEQLSELPEAQELVPDLQARLAELDIEVSPRYGAISEGNELVAVDRPWLVATEDEVAGQ